ncbi:carboxypeptidase regulatory-like domain-containing protein [Sedimenticola sp.]|uniref:carboxypeptidase regulatory-like domain-containing protein n=1 Tax=Sedimenticola sp. TaxID=1940285 RepID=UPI003D1489BB
MSHVRLICLLLLLVQGSAEAHLLKLFAYVEGEQIHGSVYFAGGANAAGAALTVRDADDRLLAEFTTDAQGVFSYTPAAPGDYQLRADTGDGHQAEWRIRTDEFAASLPTDSKTVTSPAQTAPAQQNTPSDARLAALIEQALAHQIGPLREALQRSEARARLSDIIGGVGFIFGLAGVALWWRNRKGPPSS